MSMTPCISIVSKVLEEIQAETYVKMNECQYTIKKNKNVCRPMHSAKSVWLNFIYSFKICVFHCLFLRCSHLTRYFFFIVLWFYSFKRKDFQIFKNYIWEPLVSYFKSARKRHPVIPELFNLIWLGKRANGSLFFWAIVKTFANDQSPRWALSRQSSNNTYFNSTGFVCKRSCQNTVGKAVASTKKQSRPTRVPNLKTLDLQ